MKLDQTAMLYVSNLFIIFLFLNLTYHNQFDRERQERVFAILIPTHKSLETFFMKLHEKKDNT